MANDRKNEEGNPDLTHLESPGVPAGGRQSIPDARPLSPGDYNAPGAHADREPKGPKAERKAEYPDHKSKK